MKTNIQYNKHQTGSQPGENIFKERIDNASKDPLSTKSFQITLSCRSWISAYLSGFNINDNLESSNLDSLFNILIGKSVTCHI